MNPYYREYSDFLAEYFEGKVQKLSIDIGCSCPNRDGSIGTGGCIYCNNLAFSPDADKRQLSVSEQIERGRRFFAKKYSRMKYLAYFQSYTSTYGKDGELIDAFAESLSHDDIVGMVIGTRPDCMPDYMLDALKTFTKPIFVEYGVESSHNKTLQTINRCHTWECAVDAIERTASHHIPVGVHLILGLPGEDEKMMIETVRRVSQLPVSTIKFHQLQILRGTILERCRESFPMMMQFSAEEYISLCARLLNYLRPDIAIDRFVAQAPDNLLVSPRWGLKNYQFTALLHRHLASLR